MVTKVKSTLRGNRVRTVVKVSNPKNYTDNRMAAVVYRGNKKPIKQSKTVYKTNTKNSKMKVKTKTFSPANYYGKQKKTVVKKKFGY